MHDRRDRASPARPRHWRRPPLAALVASLAITLAVAACAGGGDNHDGVASLGGSGQPTATTSAGGTTDPKQAALDFARCMRQHGIDMPDPTFDANGRMSITVRGGPGKLGPDDPKFKAAQQACQKYLPNGGKPRQPNAQQLQQLVQFARCMRQHGIDIPDPDANGGIRIEGDKLNIKPDDPKFKAAQQACEKYLPGAGKGGTFTVQGGGSSGGGGGK